jgi:hypothetical protein
MQKATPLGGLLHLLLLLTAAVAQVLEQQATNGVAAFQDDRGLLGDFGCEVGTKKPCRVGQGF